MVVSLFAGDAVASEGQWGSLRYLLTRPIPRARLLRTKLVVAALYAAVAVVLVPIASVAMGTVAFGWSSVQTPLAGALELSRALHHAGGVARHEDALATVFLAEGRLDEADRLFQETLAARQKNGRRGRRRADADEPGAGAHRRGPPHGGSRPSC